MNEGEIIGAGIIVAACILVCGITYLKRKLGILGGFLIRAGAGTGLICLGNYVLSLSGISLAVGVGPVSVLTCAILGIPGVFLMYGIMLI
ncbi:MAG: pro-sigmaK processing inhibitor BofA family protein [Lachnospiraceae bacterium]|nr:pro-sigmaK processing inhibitor BofA family protein [Lachnospiraceae bacterium]